MSEIRETTYSQARATLAALCDEVTSSRQPVLIRRRNAEDVVLLSADELAGLTETAHLLRSPNNARRLLTALNRALDDHRDERSLDESGLAENDLEATSVQSLREDLGLGSG